jgi:type II secretory pathway component PulF
MEFLQPLLMVVIAGVIGVIMWSILIPMADLVNVIK